MNIERGQLTFFKTSTKLYQISSFQEIDTT